MNPIEAKELASRASLVALYRELQRLEHRIAVLELELHPPLPPKKRGKKK